MNSVTKFCKTRQSSCVTARGVPPAPPPPPQKVSKMFVQFCVQNFVHFLYKTLSFFLSFFLLEGGYPRGRPPQLGGVPPGAPPPQLGGYPRGRPSPPVGGVPPGGAPPTSWGGTPGGAPPQLEGGTPGGRPPPPVGGGGPPVDRQTENITFPSYSVCGR